MASGKEISSPGSENKVFLTFNEEDQSIDTHVRTAQNTRTQKVPRKQEEIEQTFPYKKPKPSQPEPLPQTTLGLYQKAIDDPDSITESERLSIHDWVTGDVVEERCRKACGVPWQKLLAKAVDNPAELTMNEIAFVQQGRSTTYGDSAAGQSSVFGKLLQPEHVVNLCMSLRRAMAQDATQDPQYAKAESNAQSQSSQIHKDREEAFTHLSENDIAGISQTTQIPWIARLRASSETHWGLICFRTSYGDEEAWTRYKIHILHSSQTGLWYILGTDSIGKPWNIHFIEDDKETLDGASIKELCTYFNDPPALSSIPSAISSGLRKDVFLFADSRAITSLNDPPNDPHPEGWTQQAPVTPRDLFNGYINAVDACYNPRSKTYTHGFEGVLKVHPAHLATTFYQRLLPRGQEKGKERWWLCMQDWETMHMRANGRNKREGGVYPPDWVYNR